jgi:hypothetical protein
MNKNSQDQLATKHDVEEIIGRVVGEIVGAALQLIAYQFDEIHKVMATKTDIARFEHKLDATIDVVTDHGKQLSQLKIQLA